MNTARKAKHAQSKASIAIATGQPIEPEPVILTKDTPDQQHGPVTSDINNREGKPEEGGAIIGQGSLRAQELALMAKAEMPRWIAVYITELCYNGGHKGQAATKADVPWSSLIDYRKRHPEFAVMEADAMACSKQVAEDECRRRALQGVVTMRQTTVKKNGEVVTHEKIEYSDIILLRLMERLETGSWRQKQQIEVNNPLHFPTRAARLDFIAKKRQAAEAAAKIALGGGAPLSTPSENGTTGGQPTE